ncbi:hypothetical protein CH275_16635 [Rhodococcus sp. 06-235-1A]|uniref:hypothetical protein n=1 Tax=Rhodococcus sp. 06-235-1A TaxID=2022508 RepID=UPI000B9B1E79|nr:hypothetical protein [Rhodococcus sp. 06-235-1A]OZD03400.1 hypothetical protein CH275_16635 [Rhodococcus sp. 06-235-1A]
MSARKRRAAFDPNALDDLDDLLPPINLVRDAAAAGGNTPSSAAEVKRQEAAMASAVETKATVASGGSLADSADGTDVDSGSFDVDEVNRSQPASPASEDAEREDRSVQSVLAQLETDVKHAEPKRADARRKSSKKDASANVARLAPPEVALPEEVYSVLRSLTLAERTADPTTARSYGQVVLDAVEKHADDLKGHWAKPVVSTGTGLFRRVETGRPTRRRHNSPRARVPLAGVINTDAAVLDQLASDWGAGSRSALVEQALRLYLDVH